MALSDFEHAKLIETYVNHACKVRDTGRYEVSNNAMMGQLDVWCIIRYRFIRLHHFLNLRHWNKEKFSLRINDPAVLELAKIVRAADIDKMESASEA